MSEQRPKPKPSPKAAQDNAPWHPAPWTPEVVGAFQALQRGDAQPHQQQLALRWLIETGCETYGLGWHPTGPHEASFAAGRRFAGLQVVKLLNLNLSALRRIANEQT